MSHEAYPDLIREFALDVRERLDRLERVFLDAGERLAHDPASLDVVRAELHTVKGNSGMMGFAEMQDLAHRTEEAVTDESIASFDVQEGLAAVDALRRQLQERMSAAAGVTASDDATPDGGVRVSFAAIDQLVDLVAELVILRNRFNTAVVQTGRAMMSHDAEGSARASAWQAVVEAEAPLARVLNVIQERVLQLRLTPLQMVFGSVRRIVHDEARRIGKQVALQVQGGGTQLDKALLELAGEALGHLVRNAVIHGIEPPDERRKAGKPAEGTVLVEARMSGDEVQIRVGDDGGGMDQNRLKAAAREKGVTVPADVYSVVFSPGFTTHTTTDLGAGRGVGLSAVRDAVARRGGDIEIHSEVGTGTTFVLRLPLSVSITRALLTSADDETYALPLASVVTSVPVGRSRQDAAVHSGMLQWRGDLLAVTDLGCFFDTRRTPRDRGSVLVVEASGRRRGLLVDRVEGIQEVVVKGLDPVVGHPQGVGGATVLGDGRAVLLLEPRALVEVTAGCHREAS